MLFTIACQYIGNTYSNGNVEIVDYIVYDEDEVRYCIIYYKISNTGRYIITISTISINISTNLYNYYETIVNETIILPNKDVYGNYTLKFIENTEDIDSINNILIDSYFFE